MDKIQRAAEAAPKTGSKDSNYLANSQSIINPSEAISADVVSKSKPFCKSVGRFNLRSFNDTIAEARLIPDSLDLYRSLWYEGGMGCFFGHSGLGKSIFAMQIAEEIAENNPKLKIGYINCELNIKQIQSRYDNGVSAHKFPENAIEIELDRVGLDYTGDYTASVVDALKVLFQESGIKIYIIDNITAILPNAADGKTAAGFMNQMKGIVNEFGLSILFIAHTTKRYFQESLKAADLAGGYQIFALCDDVFAIGKSNKGQDIRYIKQLKCRGPQGAIYDNADQVLTFQKTRGESEDYLHFDFIGLESESDHLTNNRDDNELLSQVQDMRASGMSLRKIQKATGISKDTIARKLKAAEDNNV